MKEQSMMLIISFFILFSCTSSDKKNADLFLQQENYQKAWTHMVRYVKENPSDKEAYFFLIRNIKPVISYIDPAYDKLKEVNKIKEQKDVNEKNRSFFDKVVSDFTVLNNAFCMNERLKENDWYINVKLEFENIEKELKSLVDKSNLSEQNLEVTIDSHDNMARKLYNSGIDFRNSGNYKLAKFSLELSSQYNTDYMESVKLITKAMDLHEQAEEKFQSDKNSIEGIELIREAIVSDPTNPVITKRATPFINKHLQKAANYERQGFYGKAIVEYNQVHKFYRSNKMKAYEIKKDALIKKIKNTPLISISIIARDDEKNIAVTNKFVSKIENDLRQKIKSAGSYLNLKPSYLIKNVSHDNNSNPIFNGVDVALGISVPNFGMEPLEEYSNPRYKDFTLCRRCKVEPNPDKQNALERIVMAETGVSTAEQTASNLRAMGHSNAWADAAVVTARNTLSAYQVYANSLPDTIMVDDIQQATWTEVKKTQTASVDIKVMLYASGEGMVDSFNIQGKGKYSDVSIEPGQYSERVGVVRKEARLKSDEELKKIAVNDSINQTVDKIMEHFTKDGRTVCDYISRKCSAGTDNIAVQDMSCDLLIRYLINVPDSPDKRQIIEKLSKIMPEYNIEEIL